MLAFGYIYILILCMSIISMLIYRKINNHIRMITGSAWFYVIYYYIISLFRTIVSGGNGYLGTSFVDKSARAYIKVGILGVVVFVCVIVFFTFTKENGQRYMDLTVGIFSSLSVLYTVLIDIPRMKVVIVLGGISLIVAALLVLVWKEKKWLPEKEVCTKRYREIGATVLLFGSLFLLNGPLELFAYNTNDFVFNLRDFLPYMIIYTVMIAFFSIILLGTFAPAGVFSFTKITIFIYCICSYIQQLFLNGNMSAMEGNEQRWNVVESVGNAVVWIVMIVVLLLILYKSQKGDAIILYSSAFLVGVQLITFLTVLFTSNIIGGGKQQLVENNNFILSPNENVVVFILDAYDTQMLDKVLADEPQYLDPLHDFTYYNNMKSRYTATDGSLPYLLTGRIAEEEETYGDIYDKSTFLSDIKGYGYDINILTADYYVEPLEQGIVDNWTEDYYCILDFEKTVSQLSKCIRYRNTPFVVKSYYYYKNYDLTNVIHDTNVYLFGTDARFDSNLCEKGISIDPQKDHMMHIYHLYGAHSPYYLSETGELDYASNPIAQWKGCLKIVYDYLEKLNEVELYDNTSIIIMADHGLNRTQRLAMDEWNISVTEESNPIFFIKRKNQKGSSMLVDPKSVSHDQFFSTVINLIDEKNEKYGSSVWE